MSLKPTLRRVREYLSRKTAWASRLMSQPDANATKLLLASTTHHDESFTDDVRLESPSSSKSVNHNSSLQNPPEITLAEAPESRITKSQDILPAKTQESFPTELDAITPIKTHEEFKYEALHGKTPIRVLILEPGNWDSDIQCRLSNIDLSIPGQAYEAISYVWGDAAARKDILCNGFTFNITKSLYDALQVFRRPAGCGVRVLWADGLCINQQDTLERNHQVALMRHIYTASSRVLIWLGHADAETVRTGLDSVCRFVGGQIKKQKKGKTSQSSEQVDVLPSPQYRMYDDDFKSCQVIRPPDSTFDAEFVFQPDSLESLLLLFEARWFERVWVVQELILSSSAEVFWGPGQICFDMLGLAADHLYHNQHVEVSGVGGMVNCANMYYMWKTGTTTFDLFYIMWALRDRDATNPLDKVFGILGLPTKDYDPDTALFMEPDYTLSKAEVYLAATKKMLLQGLQVDILAAVQHGPQIADDWTSWVPDWSCRLTSYIRMGDTKILEACGNIAIQVTIPDCTTCTTKNHDSIAIPGLVADTVASLAENYFDLSRIQGIRVSAWLEAIKAIIHQYQSLYDDSIIARCLTAGRGMGISRVEGEDEPGFMADYHAFVEDIHSIEETGLDISNATDEFLDAVIANVKGHRFFVTADGMLGLGPVAIEEGDVLTILFGGSVPFLLRPDGDGMHFRLVGECYVRDIMEGQPVKRWQEKGEPAVDFHIY